ncbi:transposase [bacterium]|nr:transposase [Candidatus Atribacteria bacterium]MBU4046858.1 transposase [bacterium]MBU4562934.1 transposase [bacterium]MCG2761987.1 transposase [Candidatus Atribacteria bacterium]
MSFQLNNEQQMAINDALLSLTEREMKYLKGSWAETFSKKIFPFIEEDRFKVLYSDNPASRPNNPANVYFGLLILREIFNQSDEEALNSLMFDIRYQYALHTTSFQEQPVSKNSLTNFRAAVYSYNQEHGIDLIQEEIESHAQQFSKLLKIEGKTIRMDSLMVSSSCRKLSRLEIIYSTVARLIKVIDKNATLAENFKPYQEEGHYNDTIYRSRDKDLNSKIKKVLKDGLRLHHLYRKNKEISKTEEFKLLSRMLKEQTRKGRIKPSKEISPDSLQNPTDPDATYRKKGKKKHIGYTVNIVEKFDDKNRMITGYDLQKNTYSDQKFAQDTISKLPVEKDEVTALVDGAYYSEDIAKKAEAKGIKMVPTNLVGGGKNSNSDKFEIDEKEHTVKKCPSGHQPITSTFKEGSYRAHFNQKHCSNCPLRKDCSVVKQKKSYLFKVSEKTFHRSQLIAKMGTSEYQELARKRAGIEGIPSTLRRRYKIDHLPVRGEVRSKVWLGFKISAINCKRLIKGLMNRPIPELSTLLYNHLFSLFSFQRTYRVKFAA